MTVFFDSMAERWLAWVVSASWQIAILVAVVALIVRLARRVSPRIRYALWLLVLVKVFLPPSLTIGWGVGSWGLSPLWSKIQPATQPLWNTETVSTSKESSLSNLANDDPQSTAVVPAIKTSEHLRPATLLFFAWSLAGLLFFLFVLLRYQKLKQSLSHMQLVDEGPLRIRLEQLAIELGETHLPELYLSDEASSPFLFGLSQPRIVLPRQLADCLVPGNLESVLQHELYHWRCRDPWVGWLQVFAQGLFWFHPFVWLANTRLRHERECVCDEAVLRTGKCEPARYGEALLAVLSAARGRSPVQGSLVGVFEPGANIQTRLEEIMSYEPGKRPFGLPAYFSLAIFAVLFLPMALPKVSAKTETLVTKESLADEPQVRVWPWIAKTVPAVGATDVDPELKEISVTFNRDMQRGMSWTGNKKTFMPLIPKGVDAQWSDTRTCVLPVKLAKGQYYRVGINATSFHNFKSAEGDSAPCSVIYFTTRSASKSVQRRVRVPKLVQLTPENGAVDAKPTAIALRATFNMPMGAGMSWTGGGDRFPTITPGKKPKWTGGGKTCVLPVALEPGRDYQLGLNSHSHINFQSKWGVPLEPVVYRFQTADVAK